MRFSDVSLMDIHRLRPHEQIDQITLELLTSKIKREGFWMVPVIVDKDTSIIMDGHHRYNFALQSGLSVIPCYEISYSSDIVRVYHWQTGQPFPNEKIIEHVETGNIFPPKTTRHVFDMVFDTVKIEISSLY